MAFEFISGGSFDLFNLIFNQILKITPNLLNRYTNIPDQVLHLILLPHVILFLFLWGFGQAVSTENKGLRYLVMLVSYIFIVMQGWYGTFLVPLLEGWFMITLIIGLFLFFVTRIIHPATMGKLSNVSAKIAREAGKSFTKDKEIHRLAEELENIEKQIRYNQERARHGDTGASQVLGNLQNRKFEIERRIKDLE